MNGNTSVLRAVDPVMWWAREKSSEVLSLLLALMGENLHCNKPRSLDPFGFPNVLETFGVPVKCGAGSGAIASLTDGPPAVGFRTV